MCNSIISLSDPSVLNALFGPFDCNLKRIERNFLVSVSFRDSKLSVSGETFQNVSLAEKTIRSLIYWIESGNELDETTVQYHISMIQSGNSSSMSEVRPSENDYICLTQTGKPIKPKTIGQKKYVDAIQKNTVTIGIGPAGTGKTYLAVACAVAALRNKTHNRLILTRPAIEAGERLGFLPGDLQSKVDPYLRPLYDGLYEMLGAENFQHDLERGVIEVAPLAYMRGRTLDNAFIILDEAQNTTPEQMKMFLTRLGFGSKAIVNGDITQIDLPSGKKSGLADAVAVLSEIDDIALIHFTASDVVRHELVQKIINAYEKRERLRKQEENKSQHVYRLHKNINHRAHFSQNHS